MSVHQTNEDPILEASTATLGIPGPVRDRRISVSRYTTPTIAAHTSYNISLGEAGSGITIILRCARKRLVLSHASSALSDI
jgi:hypothetical protein